ARARTGRMDAGGGTLAAIGRGFIQREIQDAASAAQQRIEAGEGVVVGVNRYTDEPQGRLADAPQERRRIDTLRIDPELEGRQVARVRQVRASRDAPAWRASLEAVTAAARGRDNLVPPT